MIRLVHFAPVGVYEFEFGCPGECCRHPLLASMRFTITRRRVRPEDVRVLTARGVHHCEATTHEIHYRAVEEANAILEDWHYQYLVASERESERLVECDSRYPEDR